MSDQADVLELTEEECRANRQAALDKVGMTLAEYRAHVSDKCHPKCWRPDDAPAGAWYAIDVWDSFLNEGRHA